MGAWRAGSAWLTGRCWASASPLPVGEGSDGDGLQQAQLLVDLALVAVGAPLDHLVERDGTPQPARLEGRVGQRDVGAALFAGHLGVLAGAHGLAQLEVLEREDARVGVVEVEAV